MKICSRCIYDQSIKGIYFDDNGVCNYCKQIDMLQEEYGTGRKKGVDKLNRIFTTIKNYCSLNLIKFPSTN